MQPIEQIKRAEQIIRDLCHGQRRWIMRVPVHPDDPDVVISGALRAAKEHIIKLETELLESQGVQDSLRGALIISNATTKRRGAERDSALALAASREQALKYAVGYIDRRPHVFDPSNTVGDIRDFVVGTIDGALAQTGPEEWLAKRDIRMKAQGAAEERARLKKEWHVRDLTPEDFAVQT